MLCLRVKYQSRNSDASGRQLTKKYDLALLFLASTSTTFSPNTWEEYSYKVSVILVVNNQPPLVVAQL